MAEISIIRQYMVSLGFDVSKSSFSQAQNSLNQIAKSIAGFTGSIQSIAAAAGVTATVAALATGFEQLTLGVAGATIKNQEFARQMWMDYDSATAFSSSLEALHISIQDIYLSPTLMNAFIQFRQLAQQMKTPADFQSTMDNLAQITFQFDEFKLEASYAIQWVGYALAKELSGNLGNFQDGLKKLNTWIVSTMPQWTSKIAAFIVKIVDVFKDIYDAGADFVKWWDNLGSKWQHVIEISAGLIIGIMAIGKAITIVMGIAAGLANLPLLAISAALLGIILLVQDFMTYQAGGQGALGGLWAWVDQMAKSPEIAQLKQSFDDFKQSLEDVFGAFGDVLTAIANLMGTKSAIQLWQQLFNAAIESITSNLETLAGEINIVSGLIRGLTGLLSGNQSVTSLGQIALQKGVEQVLPGSTTGAPLWQTILEYMLGGPSLGNTGLWHQLLGQGKAAGGPASGLTVVGEKGPELLNLPGGSRVFSNGMLTNMLNAFKNLGSPQASNKTSTITISPVYYISGAGSPQQTADAIQGNNLSLIMRVQSGLIA